MRLIFGIILGIALTVGAAYMHNSRASAGPSLAPLEPPAALAEGEIVNWDVLGAVVSQQVRFLRTQFDKLIGG